MSDGLPEGWITTTLKEGLISNIQTGFACGQHSRDDRGVAHLRPMNINQDGRIVLNDVKYIDPGEVDRHERWLRPGDVVFNNTNSPELVGKTALYELPDPRAFSNHMTRLRCADALNPKFCALLLHHRWQQGEFSEKCNNHVSQASVSREALLDTDLNLPPLREQHRIVEVVGALLQQVSGVKMRLDRVALILKRFRQAVLTAAYRGGLTDGWRATLEHTRGLGTPSLPESTGRFGLDQEVDLPELPSTWSCVPIGNIASFQQGMQIAKATRFTEPGRARLPILRIGNYATRFTEDVEYASVNDETLIAEAEDLILTRTGETRGKVLTGYRGVFHNNTFRINYDKTLVLRGYLLHWLQTREVQTYITERSGKSAQPDLTHKAFGPCPLALAPLEEQEEVVRRIEALFGLIETLEQRLATTLVRTDRLPQAVLAKAFSGELVPTEADLARAEARTYETAEELLTRVRQEAESGATAEGSGVRRAVATNGKSHRAKRTAR